MLATVDAQSSVSVFCKGVVQGLAETISDLVAINLNLEFSQSCVAMHKDT